MCVCVDVHTLTRDSDGFFRGCCCVINHSALFDVSGGDGNAHMCVCVCVHDDEGGYRRMHV